MLQKIFARVVEFLEKLGFLVKREKCSSLPCQHTVFPGASLDSTTMTLFLPQPNLTSIVDTWCHLLAQRNTSVRNLSTLIGRTKHVHLRINNTTAVAYINKRGNTLCCSNGPSLRVVRSSLGSGSSLESAAHSRNSEWGSRHSLQADRDFYRMDLGQEDLTVNLSEVLQTRGRPLCIPLEPSSTQVCLEVPRSRGSGSGCISSGLEQMDLSNPSSHSPFSSDPQENQRRTSNSAPNCTE